MGALELKDLTDPFYFGEILPRIIFCLIFLFLIKLFFPNRIKVINVLNNLEEVKELIEKSEADMDWNMFLFRKAKRLDTTV